MNQMKMGERKHWLMYKVYARKITSGRRFVQRKVLLDKTTILCGKQFRTHLREIQYSWKTNKSFDISKEFVLPLFF